MNNYIAIEPNKLKGEIIVPPSKSMTHRAIVCASLSRGVSHLSNIIYSEDIMATINGMRAFGARIQILKDSVIVDGSGFYMNRHKLELDSVFLKKSAENEILKNELLNYVVDCNESGSTLRFLIPLALLLENTVIFKGSPGLSKRPVDVYTKIFAEQGISHKLRLNSENEFEFEIKGSLKAGKFSLRGDVSSQFISGLLFALPLLEQDSVLKIEGEIESKSYVDLTLQMQETFGVKIENLGYGEFKIEGRQEYRAKDVEIEGDYSQAAFYIAANEMGSCISLKGLALDSKQGDKQILPIVDDIFKLSLDEDVCLDEENVMEIDGRNFPDIIPIICLAGGYSKKKIRIVNIKRLRIKESDRIFSTVNELSKLGYDIYEKSDEIYINFRKGELELSKASCAEVDSHNDHRIAMMLGIASTISKGTVIVKNPECVKKSYPDFWKQFKMLGGKYEQYMGE